MLQNNQTLPANLSLSLLFKKMVSELPWNTFLLFLRSNGQLFKMTTAGGYRLDPKNRRRLEDVIFREGEKTGFSQMFTSSLFAAWYPVHADLHRVLEGYFRSEEYEELQKKEGKKEDVYFLTDEKFAEFFNEKEIVAWRILLCFSPLTLSDEQICKLSSEKKENITIQSKELDSLQKEIELLNQQKKNAEESAKQARNEMAEQKRLLAEMKKEFELNQTRLNSMQNENQKLRKQIDEVKDIKVNNTQELMAEKERLENLMKADLETVKNEVKEWKKRYENRCVEDREKERLTAIIKDEVEELKGQLDQAKKQNAIKEKFADTLLSRFDWAEIGTRLKPTATVKRQFTNLLKKIDYDEDRGLIFKDSLNDFWQALTKQEVAFVQKIADSEVAEIATLEAGDFWKDMEDQFDDICLSLEAKVVLLKLLQSIFYETINNEALETPVIYDTIFKK